MLSKKAQYAIHAMVNLARKHQQGPVLIKTIAKEEKIPRKFLESILIELKNLGLVNSKKGKGGGYYLINDPEEINMAFITRNFNGALGLIPCACIISYESCSHCKDENSCAIKKVFRELRDMTADYLENVNLAKLLEMEEALKKQTGKIPKP